MKTLIASFAVTLATAVCADALLAQGAPSADPGTYKAPVKVSVERTGPHTLRLGAVRVDTASREVSVTGHINDVTTLEWVANTVDGFKEYESAISADTDAITFNTAMLLIGLDKAHARVPTQHFDKEPPRGDPVEIWVDWSPAFTPTLLPAVPLPERPAVVTPLDRSPATRKRVRVEALLLDKRTNTTLSEGPWVYTGSQFLPGTTSYQAQLDGVLIGFVHSPAPVIENPRAGAVGAYGSVVLNKAVIPPSTKVTLIVKALPAAK